MSNFKGFESESVDILWGIRLNNNKEWFHENKDKYQKYIHNPVTEFADICYNYLNNIDENFKETPKISRANRDIRFSKNKMPYKESKWFFLRGDGSPSIMNNKPTYFFEISPDWYRFGFFYAPQPSKMALFRKKVESDISGFKRIIDEFNSQDSFKLEGDKYKRIFNKNLDEDILDWYQRKELIFVNYRNYEDNIFYSEELEKLVTEGFKNLYPLYKYFSQI